MKEFLLGSSSPHIRHEDTTRGIMADVIIALAPAAIFGCVLFGWKAVFLILTTIISSVAAEYLWNLILHKKQTIGDLSAVVTGLLLGMNLSPLVPIWVAAIGGVVAIIVVKQMFGGLGFNFANPAIAARIVLLVSFPSYMASFVRPFPFGQSLDAFTSPTPLAALNGPVENLEFSLKDLFFGTHAGSIGETCAFLLLIGGVYLVLRRVINPIIPISFIGTVALLSLVSGSNVGLSVFGGGVMLGAIFMATDYTTSPVTNWGKLVFGIGCGAITFVIRRFAALPEGVSYAILLMNILTPHINKLTLSKPFGMKEGLKNE